jgi:hypothetical protein
MIVEGGHAMSPRSLIWAALGVELAGQAFDITWHALNPDFNATTVREMAWHLGTVHFPIYAGVACVLLATAWALLDGIRRSRVGVALPIAFAGALVSATGESWHAYEHLQLSTHAGPIAAAISFGGFIVVLAALWSSRHRDRHRADDIDQRRAA